MAEAVSSAVVHETVSEILPALVQNFKEKCESNTNSKLERLEMAHIKLEAALETSYKWQITDASLLRWRKKLKCAAKECNDMLHKCKQRILEDEQITREVSNSSLPNRIAHATKSFVFSVFSGNNNELSNSTVGRFEFFADGASEFLRFIELGGTPRRHIPFQSLVNKLLAGMELYHTIVRGNEYPVYRLWLVPRKTSEYGIEALLTCFEEDSNGPEGNIYFSTNLQLSESTDIVGITIKCLYLLAPHIKCPVENIRKELTELYTQDLSWMPSVYSCQKEHWDNHYRLRSEWFRSNPLCCKQHYRHEYPHSGSLDREGLSDVSLEPVVEVRFHTFLSKDIISRNYGPYLKVGISFGPHGSSESILPGNRSSPTLTVVGKEQYCLHTDITMEQLKEMLLPKAIDYFRQNANVTVFQMIWKSEHSYALIHFEKANMSTRRTYGGARKRKWSQGQDQGPWCWGRVISRFVNLWGEHMPTRMRRFYVDWLRKEKEGQFTAEQRHPYFLYKVNNDTQIM